MGPETNQPSAGIGRFRALVLSYCHPFYLDAAEVFASILYHGGGLVTFMPASRYSRADVMLALTQSSFDLVAYFGHGDRNGWHGYWRGFRPHELSGIRRQKLFISTACHGISQEDDLPSPLGAHLVEMELAKCFLGSTTATDSEVGRIYMTEFARALSDGSGSVEQLHQKAKAASRVQLLDESWASLDALGILGDSLVRVAAVNSARQNVEDGSDCVQA